MPAVEHNPESEPPFTLAIDIGGTGLKASVLGKDGTMGPVTTAIHAEFFAIVNGTKPQRHSWI